MFMGERGKKWGGGELGGGQLGFPETLPRGLIGLGLRRNDGGIRGYCPFGSGVEGESRGRGRVKEEDNNKEDDYGWTDTSASLETAAGLMW